jgi:hypothetical protein
MGILVFVFYVGLIYICCLRGEVLQGEYAASPIFLPFFPHYSFILPPLFYSFLSYKLTWYQSQRFWVQTLTPSNCPPFKLNIPRVGHHLLKGSLSPHVRGSVKVIIK